MLPIREVTVFKDGNAFLVREGSMPTDSSGNVVMDELPAPEFGTFFPYSNEHDAPLKSVVASRDEIDGTRKAQSIPEILRANVGQQVDITLSSGDHIKGTISDTQQNGSGYITLIKTDAGMQALPVDDIRTLVVAGTFHDDVAQPSTQPRLTLTLGWHGKPSSTANVGLMYLQNGLRWIPEYKVSIDGAGNAHVILQATLENDLADLDDVTANLVIGVPTFDFGGVVDPIALQQTLGQMAQSVPTGQTYRFQNALSNGIFTQDVYANRVTDGTSTNAPAPPPPTVDGGDKAEDLFVFSVDHVTLKKGQVMVLVVKEFDLKYTDVYTLDLPAHVPTDLIQYLDYNTQQTIKTEAHTIKVLHKIRLVDNAGVPLTTAPALILRGKQLISQGTMTYTPAGGTTDLTVSQAVNVCPTHKDDEIKNTPNVLTWNGVAYARVDYAGTVDIKNEDSHDIDIEVTRHVLGHVDTASDNGDVETRSSIDEDGYTVSSNYNEWWDHLNGYGRIFWKMHIATGKSVGLTYQWHYLYR